MNDRGQYGHNGHYAYLGAARPTEAAPPSPSKPWWGNVLGYGLAIGFVGALGYVVYGFVKADRAWDKETAREKSVVGGWSQVKRDKWSESGLTVDAFEDWLKTGRGMTVSEWMRATPEKG